jgi:NAD(P)-dependent dehydrogenase (short-subunit alcohol dehydrogenase family)
MFALDGKIAAVTGSASGIGQAVCKRFLAAGARVAGLDRQPSTSHVSHAIVCDVSDETQLAAALDDVIARFGRLDVLVNNAGIQPLGVDFDNLTPGLLDRTFAVNVRGAALGIKHAARRMSAGGRILNTASFVGMIGVPRGAAYATSKAAVIHLTKLAALELAPRAITVNCVCPGVVRTPAVTGIPDNPEIPFAEKRTPLGRLAEPEEIAAAFHFLASPEASYITGAIVPVDGGITAGWESYDVITPANIQDGKWIE